MGIDRECAPVCGPLQERRKYILVGSGRVVHGAHGLATARRLVRKVLPMFVVAAFCTVAAPAYAKNENARLDALAEEFFEESLKLYPSSATSIGDHRYDDRLENPASTEFHASAAALDRKFLAAVRDIDIAQLDAVHRITYDVFRSERELGLQRAQFPLYLLPLHQMDSMASTVALLGSGAGPQPFDSVRDYDAFLSRLEGFVRWVDSAIAGMREGMAKGVTQPAVAMQKTVPQLRAVGVADPEQSLFWIPISSMPKEFDAANRERLSTAYRTALGGQVLPAYRRLADFIEYEYLPRARSSVAWTALPNGSEWYAFSVREQTTTSLTPAAIHDIGLAEVARIRSEMEAVKARVGFKDDLQAFFAYVQDDPEFYFASAENLLQGYRDLQRRIDARLPDLFADFPQANYEVRAVEAFRAASAAGASYQPPSADGGRPGIFYVNTFNLKAQPKFGMETLSLHEASPGHHFQVSIQQELTGLPRIRRFAGYTAYREGWALYAESLGQELGLFTDPYQWYGRLSDEMLRAMRLVVDTGLHSQGWTRERAIEYMRANSSLAESDAIAEVERYIVMPGQALGYKLGQLRITALRERAAKALGPRFDVKAFHSQVLRDGALPLDVLEAKVDRWIAQVKSSR